MTVLDRLRRPAYTGPKRCWPCTVLNGVVLLAGVGITALVSTLAAVGLLLVGVLAIWFRGYLVPFTPRFGPKIAGSLPVRLPGKRPAYGPGSVGDATTISGEALMKRLVETGVLTVENEQVALATEFEAAWNREQETLQEYGQDALASAVVDVCPDAADVRSVGQGGEWLELGGGTWISRPVAIAEVAAIRALEDDQSSGTPLSPAYRRAAAKPVRNFLTHCPACDAELVERNPADCCGGGDPREQPDVVVCPECDKLLYSVDS